MAVGSTLIDCKACGVGCC